MVRMDSIFSHSIVQKKRCFGIDACHWYFHSTIHVRIECSYKNQCGIQHWCGHGNDNTGFSVVHVYSVFSTSKTKAVSNRDHLFTCYPVCIFDKFCVIKNDRHACPGSLGCIRYMYFVADSSCFYHWRLGEKIGSIGSISFELAIHARNYEYKNPTYDHSHTSDLLFYGHPAILFLKDPLIRSHFLMLVIPAIKSIAIPLVSQALLCCNKVYRKFPSIRLLETQLSCGKHRFSGILFQGKQKASIIRYSLQADYGARTRHLNLGKVALYQMS